MSPRYSKIGQEQAKNEVRQLMLEAAIQEISRKGFDSANINSISIQAGFAKGTIYNYFSSKNELMLAILEAAGKEHLVFISDQVQAESDPVKRLECFFTAGFEFVEENPARAQVLISTLFGTHAEFKLKLQQVYWPMFQLVAEEILSPGVAQGVFGKMDAVETAAMIMTFYLGSASSVDEQGKTHLDPVKPAKFVLNSICV